MIVSIRRHRRAAASLAVAVLGVSACFVPAVADDMTGKDGMMMNDSMMMMKDGMKDDASKMQMTNDLAKMMVMQHMSMQMCEGGKCQKMVDADPDLKKMVADAMKMAKDPEHMKMLADQIKKDPMAMKQVIMMSMAGDAMMKDKGMGDGKMMNH